MHHEEAKEAKRLYDRRVKLWPHRVYRGPRTGHICLAREATLSSLSWIQIILRPGRSSNKLSSCHIVANTQLCLNSTRCIPRHPICNGTALWCVYRSAFFPPVIPLVCPARWKSWETQRLKISHMFRQVPPPLTRLYVHISCAVLSLICRRLDGANPPCRLGWIERWKHEYRSAFRRIIPDLEYILNSS